MSKDKSSPKPNPFGALIESAKAGQAEKDKPKNRAPEPPMKPKRKGRAPGKRSSSAHVALKAYVTEETRKAVGIALMKSPKKQDLSGLIQELLDGWLADQPA